VGGLAVLGGVLLHHLVPHSPSRHAVRGGLRPASVAYPTLHGRPPLPILPYTARTAKTEAADGLLRSCDEMQAEVRQRLLQAQQLSKKYYDAHHRDLSSPSAIGSGCASSTGWRSRWTPRLGASWGLAMQGRSG
jgi:hypothetical protein